MASSPAASSPPPRPQTLARSNATPLVIPPLLSPSAAASSPAAAAAAAPASSPPPASAMPPPSCSPSKESSSSSPSCSPAGGSPNVAGLLHVEVISARNLPAAVLGSLLKWTPNYSNPYVVVTLHRDEFVTTTKDKSLNPTWKEAGQLPVPLPTERELLQTAGMHRSIYGAGSGGGAGKLGGGSFKQSSSSGASFKLGGKNSVSSAEFHSCYPHLHVQVYHRSDEAQSIESPPRSQQHRRGSDKLIGEVVVPMLPCLFNRSSSSRAWYTLLSDEHFDAGQIQLAMHYDVGGLEPTKGDIVRLVGYGGMEYYSKLLNANARLEVVDVFEDQVFAQCKSIEGWMLGFEFHRNLLFVVRRPSMLRDAHSQLQRVRQSPLVKSASNVWESLPPDQRRRLHQLYQLVVFSGGTVFHVITTSVNTTLHDGVQAGVKTCVNGTNEAVNLVTIEAMRILWASNNGPPTVDEMTQCLEGGPLGGRGKIVQGFVFDTKSLDKRMSDEEEEKTDEGMHMFIVDEDDEEEEEEEESKAKYLDESFHDTQDFDHHGAYEDEEKTSSALEEDNWDGDCPEQLICPITGCPMIDPVVAADGHSYERDAILQWFAVSNKSPMTGAQMPTTQVFPNFTLRKLSEEFQNKMKAMNKP